MREQKPTLEAQAAIIFEDHYDHLIESGEEPRTARIYAKNLRDDFIKSEGVL